MGNYWPARREVEFRPTAPHRPHNLGAQVGVVRVGRGHDDGESHDVTSTSRAGFGPIRLGVARLYPYRTNKRGPNKQAWTHTILFTT